MIIYGSRMYFHKNKVHSWGECEHCGAYGKQTSYQATHFGHIYFIPILPLGSRKQILRECNHCSMGNHIPLSELNMVVEGLKENFKTIITDIQDGKKEVEDEETGEMISMGLFVSAIVPELYCLNELESADTISMILDNEGMEFDKQYVQGTWNELKGQLQPAIENFKTATKVNPDASMPLFQVGRLSLLSGNIPEAEVSFKKYSQMEPEDTSPYICLAGHYEANRDWPKIVETYDILFKMIPELLSDRTVKKLYKKACKKSGLEGKYLQQM